MVLFARLLVLLQNTLLYKECFPNVKQVSLLYQVVSLVTHSLLALYPSRIPRREPPSCEAPRQQTIYLKVYTPCQFLLSKLSHSLSHQVVSLLQSNKLDLETI